MALKKTPTYPFVIALWALVGALVGLAVASYLGASPRVTIFLLVLGSGAALLLRLNLTIFRRPITIVDLPRLGPGKAGLSEMPRHEPAPAPPASSLSQLIEQDSKLTPDQARAWLDTFLAEQQGGSDRSRTS